MSPKFDIDVAVEEEQDRHFGDILMKHAMACKNALEYITANTKALKAVADINGAVFVVDIVMSVTHRRKWEDHTTSEIIDFIKLLTA